MPDGFLEDLVLVLTAISLGSALIGVLARVFLVPWLRTHIAAPVQETNRQVKINGHVSNPPTLLDTVHVVRGEVTEVRQGLTEAQDAFHVAARMFEGHTEASALDRAALWEAIGRLEGTVGTAVDGLTRRLEEHLEALTESTRP